MSETTKKDLEVSEKKTLETSAGEPTREGLVYEPHVDIIEDAEAITLFADMPGVSKSDVDIDVREGILTLNAPVRPTRDSWQPLLKEYEIGGFTRRFSLSEKIDTGRINARMDNGVLILKLPKMEQHKPRKIQIG
jgi:HSP20 family molecular chaperone IbpA